MVRCDSSTCPLSWPVLSFAIWITSGRQCVHMLPGPQCSLQASQRMLCISLPTTTRGCAGSPSQSMLTWRVAQQRACIIKDMHTYQGTHGADSLRVLRPWDHNSKLSTSCFPSLDVCVLAVVHPHCCLVSCCVGQPWCLLVIRRSSAGYFCMRPSDTWSVLNRNMGGVAYFGTHLLMCSRRSLAQCGSLLLQAI